MTEVKLGDLKIVLDGYVPIEDVDKIVAEKTKKEVFETLQNLRSVLEKRKMSGEVLTRRMLSPINIYDSVITDLDIMIEAFK